MEPSLTLASMSHAVSAAATSAFQVPGSGLVSFKVAELAGAVGWTGDCGLRRITFVDATVPEVAQQLASEHFDSDCLILLQAEPEFFNDGTGRWQALSRSCESIEIQEAVVRGFHGCQVRQAKCEAAASAVPTDPAFAALIKSFRTRLAPRAEELRRAADALDVLAIQGFCHRLKGTAASYGLPALGLDAGEVEGMCKAGIGPGTIRFPAMWLVGRLMAELGK